MSIRNRHVLTFLRSKSVKIIEFFHQGSIWNNSAYSFKKVGKLTHRKVSINIIIIHLLEGFNDIL